MNPIFGYHGVFLQYVVSRIEEMKESNEPFLVIVILLSLPCEPRLDFGVGSLNKVVEIVLESKNTQSDV